VQGHRRLAQGAARRHPERRRRLRRPEDHHQRQTADLARTIAEYGYHQQAALIAAGWHAITGKDIASFSFVFVESKPPFCTRIVTLRDDDLARGERQNFVAIKTFAKCMETGEWPGPAAPTPNISRSRHGRRPASIINLNWQRRVTMADIARIEDRIDRVAASTLEVSDALGGLRFQNMVEVMEFAKCMAVADTAVPKHLQGNPGMCLAVCVQALEWRFSPFAVANKSYVVNDRIGYESQLVHAVIEQRAPIIGRHAPQVRRRRRRAPLHRHRDAAGDRRDAGIYLAAVRKIQPKNSPLWKTKPDLQLYYNTSRDFCRAYFPDVLLGVYSQEELRDHVGPDNARDVNDRPSVGQRLKAKGQRGFNASHVERETRGGVVDESSTAKGDASHSETPHDATRHENGAIEYQKLALRSTWLIRLPGENASRDRPGG
jgi:hypothetical protein